MIARKKFLAIISASAFGLFLAGCFSRANSIDFMSRNSAFSAGTAAQGTETTQSANASNETTRSSDTAKKSTEESSKTSETASGKRLW